ASARRAAETTVAAELTIVGTTDAGSGGAGSGHVAAGDRTGGAVVRAARALVGRGGARRVGRASDRGVRGAAVVVELTGPGVLVRDWTGDGAHPTRTLAGRAIEAHGDVAVGDDRSAVRDTGPAGVEDGLR